MKKIHIAIIALALAATSGMPSICQAQNKPSEFQQKVEQYAPVKLKADLRSLSPRDQELVSIFIEISHLMDEIYWEQAFGTENRGKLRDIKDPAMRQFVEINYGPWDRMDGNKPFVPGFKEKPAGANFYPTDMTKEEFEKIKDPQKTSPYTILRRNAKGDIDVIPYHKAYERQLQRVSELLERAIHVTDNPEMRRYLEARRKALMSDEYIESDMIWLDMKKSRLDFVFGPIENYEDALFGYKTSYEAYVLLKDDTWSHKLERFAKMLPYLQEQLPCDKAYKQEKPGMESDINVYDVLYYAGDCNAGGKTIAINLPNDEKVQLKKGTRRLQLRNVMEAKFNMIAMPIAKELINQNQLKNVTFDAFFNNVCFHEVAHGLGVKNVVNGKGTVREALKNQYSAWEEAKADICGLYIVQTLIDKGEIKEISVDDAYVTFIAGLLRSVRFGATEAHGIANMMCFNYMMDNGVLKRDKEGKYMVDVKAMRKAVEGWAALVLKTQGDGDYKATETYARKFGTVRPELAKDLQKLEKANIPIDIRFDQGEKVLGLRHAIDMQAPPSHVEPDKIQKNRIGIPQTPQKPDTHRK